MQKKFILLIFLFSPLSFALAQSESNVWYFGNKAGLDFNTSPPTALTNGVLNTKEGCAVISNTQGKLLFYTDGVTIWNRVHQPMLQGEKLTGNASSTQSGVIVPQPQSPSIYYVFTVDEAGGKNGLRYSIVNMQLNKGRGGILQKNKELLDSSTERITAVAHQNGKDVWIIAHAWDSDAFHCYLLTSKGLQSQAILSNTGSIHQESIHNSIGYMKASPSGTKLAVAIKGQDLVEVFDLNKQTGKIKFLFSISMPKGSLPYGIEFSSDATKLYISTTKTRQVYQVDLQGENTETTQHPPLLIATNQNWTGALQLASNGKIYVSVFDADYLGVIHQPNLSGEACRYEERGINLQGRRAQLGLPTFIQSYFDDRENMQRLLKSTQQSIQFGKAFSKHILFETDQYTIPQKYLTELQEIIDYLKKAKGVSITISGHTDNEGDAVKNRILSENRAKAVADYFIQQGIEQSRISSQGFGESHPIALNTTATGRQKNRRIEFVLEKINK